MAVRWLLAAIMASFMSGRFVETRCLAARRRPKRRTARAPRLPDPCGESDGPAASENFNRIRRENLLDQHFVVRRSSGKVHYLDVDVWNRPLSLDDVARQGVFGSRQDMENGAHQKWRTY